MTRGGSLATLYGAEMRMVLRDRRTVFAAIVLPLLVMPAIFLSPLWVQGRRESLSRDMVHLYALDGSVARARTWIDATRARMDAPGWRGTPRGLKVRQVETEDPARSLERGNVHFVLREGRAGADGPSKEPPRAEAAGATAGQLFAEADVPGVPHLVILYRADRSASGRGATLFREALATTRLQHRQELLRERGFALRPSELVHVTETDVSTAGEAAGLALGRSLTAVLLLVVLSAGAVVATDAIAGEKERGTLETLLTTAVSRGEIVAAKHLAILTVSLALTVIQTASVLVYVGFRLVPMPAGVSAAVPPSVAGLLLLLYLPVAALASAVLLIVSGFARSYKEAQLYFLPVFLLGLVPALAPFLPGLSLRSAILLVPISNVAVAVKDLLAGSRDWISMGVAWLVTAAAALLVSRAAAGVLSQERLVVPASRSTASLARGPALFEAHVTRWFAVMWAATFVVALNRVGSDVRRELLFNLFVVFLAVPIVILRAYRLDVRSVLALRLPRPAVWLAVAIGAPAGVLTGLAVFRLANVLIPVPPALLEGFGQALLPSDVPFWQMALLLTLLPAFCEEIAFRGLLLHGLRRSLHPAVLALTVAGVFGLFHFTLFRLVPTAFVGLLLSAVTLLTGSILPAMAWHALNNALGLLLAHTGTSALDLDVRLLSAGPAMLALAFGIVWRSRTPYPGLRVWRRSAIRSLSSGGLFPDRP